METLYSCYVPGNQKDEAKYDVPGPKKSQKSNCKAEIKEIADAADKVKQLLGSAQLGHDSELVLLYSHKQSLAKMDVFPKKLLDLSYMKRRRKAYLDPLHNVLNNLYGPKIAIFFISNEEGKEVAYFYGNSCADEIKTCTLKALPNVIKELKENNVQRWVVGAILSQMDSLNSYGFPQDSVVVAVTEVNDNSFTFVASESTSTNRYVLECQAMAEFSKMRCLNMAVQGLEDVFEKLQTKSLKRVLLSETLYNDFFAGDSNFGIEIGEEQSKIEALANKMTDCGASFICFSGCHAQKLVEYNGIVGILKKQEQQ